MQTTNAINFFFAIDVSSSILQVCRSLQIPLRTANCQKALMLVAVRILSLGLGQVSREHQPFVGLSLPLRSRLVIKTLYLSQICDLIGARASTGRLRERLRAKTEYGNRSRHEKL
jgi:hypothetical protein